MMQIRPEPLVREVLATGVLPGGMQLYVLPKPGFARTQAILSVGFGGVDREVSVKDRPEPVTFPEGTAHFLEHMLFESEGENLSDRFSACGASVNAYTAPKRTAYHFSTTNGWETPLRLLLDLVFCPRFTAEQVDKERQVIVQEIRMYQDDLDQMLYQDCMASLFAHHPIRGDIAGTPDSIATVDDSRLKEAYELFYHPARCQLVVVGDVDPHQVFAVAAAHLSGSMRNPDRLLGRIRQAESPVAHRHVLNRRRDVKSDQLMMGIKLDKRRPQSPLEDDLAEIRLAFLLDNVFGRTSPLYRQWMDQRWINDTFESSVTVEEDYGFILLFTETKKPEATAAAFREAILGIQSRFADENRFEIAKRKMIGNLLQTFDHVGSLGGFLTDYYSSGVDPFELLRRVATLTFSEIRELSPTFSEAAMATVRYHP
jgi:predicted Zn-dependent peptidase